MASVKTAKKPAAKKTAAKKVAPLAPGYQWINPFLTVKDPAAAIAFYEKAFGFKKRSAFADKAGKIQHAEITHQTGVFMLGPECPEANSKAPTPGAAASTSLYVYVENVDKTTASAKTAGGKVVQEPKDQFWGDRMSMVIDPEGHVWAFATHIKDISHEDMKSGCDSACH